MRVHADPGRRGFPLQPGPPPQPLHELRTVRMPGMARRRRIRVRRRRVAQLPGEGQITTWVFAIPMTCPPWNSGTPSALFSALAAAPVKETVMLLTVIE